MPAECLWRSARRDWMKEAASVGRRKSTVVLGGGTPKSMGTPRRRPTWGSARSFRQPDLTEPKAIVRSAEKTAPGACPSEGCNPVGRSSATKRSVPRLSLVIQLRMAVSGGRGGGTAPKPRRPSTTRRGPLALRNSAGLAGQTSAFFQTLAFTRGSGCNRFPGARERRSSVFQPSSLSSNARRTASSPLWPGPTRNRA